MGHFSYVFEILSCVELCTKLHIFLYILEIFTMLLVSGTFFFIFPFSCNLSLFVSFSGCYLSCSNIVVFSST